MAHRFPSGSLIAVTGANGYIGSHIVKLLLSSGYHVRAIARDPTSEAKVGHLRTFPGASERLQIVKGDLAQSDYETAFVGVKAVIHLATPYQYTADDPDKEIVQPAIAGTLAALNAAKITGVERVIVTSSGGAFLTLPPTPGKKFTAEDWNQTSSLTNNPYFFSKKLAEQSAWAWAKENPKTEVVVVNPLYVLGPTISGSNLNQSLSNIKRILFGEQANVLPFIGIVDVRDVAKAHLIALEEPSAVNQRLFCCNRVISWGHILDSLKRQFPDYPNTAGNPPATFTPFSIDTEPLAKLGLTSYIDIDEMFKDCVESLIAAGVIDDRRKK